MLADGRNQLAPGAKCLSGRSLPAGTRYLRPIVPHRGWQMMEVELLNEKGAGDALGRSLATLSFFAFLLPFQLQANHVMIYRYRDGQAPALPSDPSLACSLLKQASCNDMQPSPSVLILASVAFMLDSHTLQSTPSLRAAPILQLKVAAGQHTEHHHVCARGPPRRCP